MYAQIIKMALAVAKQIQADQPDLPGSEKFGAMIDILIEVFGEADITKYKAAIQVFVTLAVDVWKALSQFGFLKKITGDAA